MITSRFFRFFPLPLSCLLTFGNYFPLHPKFFINVFYFRHISISLALHKARYGCNYEYSFPFLFYWFTPYYLFVNLWFVYFSNCPVRLSVFLVRIFAHTFKIPASVTIFPSQFLTLLPLFIFVTAFACFISIFYFLRFLFFIEENLFFIEFPPNAHKAFEGSNRISKTT